MSKDNAIEKAVILVPDVHGRQFWKKIKNEKCPIVFLGDYLDPYPDEEDAKHPISNFIEILEFARSHSNVQLLLGNHDCTYMMSKELCDCRCDHHNYEYIRGLFLENRHLFKMLTRMEIGGEKYVFSHAGIHPVWLNKTRENPFGIDDINEVMLDLDGERKAWLELGDVSIERYGDDPVGSMIWADIREFFGTDLSCFDFRQIVGHTWISRKPINVGGRITCIDVCRPFFLDTEGVLREMDGEEAEAFEEE